MSHEIRTPLNAIIGMTTIGSSASDLEKKDYAFEKIQDASTHLLGVINDILDMSKIEANKFVLSIQEFSFEKMMQRVVDVINFRVDEKRQKLTVNIDPSIPLSLIGDDQRLAQVVANLLSNAVKFTPDEGSIHVEASKVSEANNICKLLVSVRDTGIGISGEQRQRLFSSFIQCSSHSCSISCMAVGLPSYYRNSLSNRLQDLAFRNTYHIPRIYSYYSRDYPVILKLCITYQFNAASRVL
jgi:signal transduction histidine kinase